MGSNFSNINSFAGFIYELYIFNINPSILALFSSNCSGCTYCPINEGCISICSIASFPYQNECFNCLNNCTYGCITNISCNLCYQENCYVCNSFENNCISCDTVYINYNGICKTCPNGKYYLNNYCEKCPELCTSCDSNIKCNDCINNSYINANNMCECFPGYYGNECIRHFFTAVLTVDTYDNVSIIFSEPLMNDLTNNDIIVTILDIIQTPQIIGNSDKTNFDLVISYKHDINNHTQIIVTFINMLLSTQYSVLSTTSTSIFLFEYHLNDVSAEVLLTKTIAKNTMIAGTSASLGLSLMNMDIKSFFHFRNSAEIFGSILLLDADIDPIIIALLSSIRSTSSLPSILLTIINPNDGENVSAQIQNFGYDTSLLLINTGMHFMMFILFIILYPLVSVLQNLKINFINKAIRSILVLYQYEIFLRL